MKTRRDEISGLPWYARNPEHALHGMRKMNPEQCGIYNRTLDRIYLTGDRLEENDHREAAENNCHIRVYRRVKTYLIEQGKIILEAVDGTVYIRNDAASREVARGRLIAESKAVNGSYGGRATAAANKANSNKNNGSTSAGGAPSASAGAAHTDTQRSRIPSSGSESTPAREGSAAQPEGRASPSAPDLTAHPNSAVRAFAATLEPDEITQWSAYQGTIEPEGKSFVILAPSGARAGLIASHFTTKLKASLKSCTIKAPNYHDTTIT